MPQIFDTQHYHAQAQARRAAVLAEAARAPVDLLIIGGGIHGGCLAREAAIRGYRTLLCEADDFAQGTSSRSSKLIHGGIRYLEQGNVFLVREALQERAIWLKTAPHLSTLCEFLFPVLPGQTRPAWQLRIGLLLYDLFAAGEIPGHRRIAAREEPFLQLKAAGLSPTALFSYFDGQMNDARITAETVFDAEALGAQVLNYAPVVSVNEHPTHTDPAQKEGGWRARIHDRVSGEELEVRARMVVNTAGPWVPELEGRISAFGAAQCAAVYSRGVHLVLDAPKPPYGLILPTGEAGRYYFVLPFFSPWREAVLVGTTDREAPCNEADPQPREEEIAELRGYLRRDFPTGALASAPELHSFCGMRVLAAPRTTKAVSRISRSELVLERKGYLALLGGKFTTARRTALKLLERVETQLRPGTKSSGLESATATRLLPGAIGWNGADRESNVRALAQALRASAVMLPTLTAVTTLLGSRSRELLRYLTVAESREHVPSTEPGSDSADAERMLARALLCYGMEHEHVVTAADLCSRRLGLSPGISPEFLLPENIASDFMELPLSLRGELKKQKQQVILDRNNES